MIQETWTPQTWTEEKLVLLFKSGSKLLLDNFRGISISDCVGKVFGKIVAKRIVAAAEKCNLWGEIQGSGRTGRSTADHIFILNTIIEIQQQRRQPLYIAFLDLRKAFDSVNRRKLWKELARIGMDQKTVNVIQTLYHNHKRRIQIMGGLSGWVSCQRGVKQGCILSPTLFTLYLAELGNRLMNLGSGIQVGDVCIPGLFYADDIALVSKSPEDMLLQLETVQDFFTERQLQLNLSKTKILKYGPGTSQEVVWSLCDKTGRELGEIRETNQYKYLGVTFSRNGRFSRHCEEKIRKMPRMLGLIKRVSGRVAQTKETAELIWDGKYKTSLLYGVEAVSVSKTLIQKFEIMQNKLGKWILKVSNRTASVGVRAELLWTRIKYEIARRRALFWYKITNKPTTSWVSQALNEQLQMNKPSRWMEDMAEALEVTGRTTAESATKWKKEVRAAFKQRSMEEDDAQLKLKRELKYYPGRPKPGDLAAVRTKIGTVISQCKLSDRRLVENLSGKRCPKCHKLIHEVVSHVCGQCHKPESDDKTQRVQKALVFRSRRQMIAFHNKYVKWLNQIG